MINISELCIKLEQCSISEYTVKTLFYLYGLLSERNRDYFCSRMYYLLGRGEGKLSMDSTDTTQDVELMDEIMDLLDGWVFNVQVKELFDNQVRCWYLYSLLPAED